MPVRAAFYKSKSVVPGAGSKLRLKLKSVLAPAKQNYESLRDMFDAIDMDGNGTVDKEEFAQLLSDIDIIMTEHELNETFSAVDTDGNMDVDFEEFQAFYKSKHALAPQAANVRSSLQKLFTMKRGHAYLKTMFDMIDTDQDGWIDREEFGLLVNDVGIHGMPADQLDDVFKEMDGMHAGGMHMSMTSSFYHSVDIENHVVEDVDLTTLRESCFVLMSGRCCLRDSVFCHRLRIF